MTRVTYATWRARQTTGGLPLKVPVGDVVRVAHGAGISRKVARTIPIAVVKG